MKNDPPQGARRQWLQAAPALLLGAAGAAGAAPPLLRGDRVNWPALLTVEGEALDTASWAGTPVVVVFWATWCAYCLRHNTRLDALYRRIDPQRLRILGVAVDGTVASVRAHLRRHGHGFPVVHDADGSLRPLFTARRVVPQTALVGRDGRLGLVIPGEMSDDDIQGLARA